MSGKTKKVDENGNTYFLEEVELEEDDGNDNYEEVDEDGFETEEEDFGAVLKSMKKDSAAAADDDDDAAAPIARRKTKAGVNQKATVVDDFIRNFLIKLNMKRTLDTFNTEWYELSEQGVLKQEDIGVVADIYQRNEELDEQVKRLRNEVKKAHVVADKARSTWDKFRKERDFHRMHHRRVVQEKNVLIKDMKRLKKHYSTFEPALQAMRAKYELAMKDKMLMKLEKDRVVTKVSTLQTQIKSYEAMRVDGGEQGVPMPVVQGGGQDMLKKTKEKKPKKPKKKVNETPFPQKRPNPHQDMDYEPMDFEKFRLTKTFKGHQCTIGGLAIHPSKQVVATASDDRTWKMWGLPTGELIMSGTGHKDWIGSVKFHPRGSNLATASGDGTVKLWDFNKAACASTYTDHTQAVWDVAFDEQGDFLVSCSMDQTARVWDLATSRCRQTLRGHVDSVNSVVFQPYSSNICTASGDKTVSLWDVRSGLCIQTLYGHKNAVLSCAFNLQGDSIASSDSDGVVKVWDVRNIKEQFEIETANGVDGGIPINDCKFDNSGKRLVLAGDAGISVWGLDGDEARMITEVQGPEGPVQALAFDPKGKFMLCGGSDCTFRLFST